MKLFFIRAIFFILGALGTFVLEVGFFYMLDAIFDIRITPKGLLWFIIPIISGVALAENYTILLSKIKGAFHIIKLKVSNSISGLAITEKIVFFTILSYFFIAITYLMIFDPYGHSISSYELSHFLKVLFFPPIMSLFLFYIYKKIFDK